MERGACEQALADIEATAVDERTKKNAAAVIESIRRGWRNDGHLRFPAYENSELRQPLSASAIKAGVLAEAKAQALMEQTEIPVIVILASGNNLVVSAATTERSFAAAVNQGPVAAYAKKFDGQSIEGSAFVSDREVWPKLVRWVVTGEKHWTVR